MPPGIQTVRIMTWNIHGGVGPDRRRDLERVADVVQRHEPDIVALQEVDSRPRRGRAEPAFETLAEALGLHSAAARLVTAPDGDYGHLVISRWPLHDTRLHDLSVGRYEPRAAIETVVATPWGDLPFFAVHLGLRVHERRSQSARLLAAARSARAAVMVGDFNEWDWTSSVYRSLRDIFPERTHVRTFPARRPMLRLDRIYSRPAGLILRHWSDPAARAASDHLPIIADLAMPSGRPVGTARKTVSEQG